MLRSKISVLLCALIIAAIMSPAKLSVASTGTNCNKVGKVISELNRDLICRKIGKVKKWVPVKKIVESTEPVVDQPVNFTVRENGTIVVAPESALSSASVLPGQLAKMVSNGGHWIEFGVPEFECVGHSWCSAVADAGQSASYLRLPIYGCDDGGVGVTTNIKREYAYDREFTKIFNTEQLVPFKPGANTTCRYKQVANADVRGTIECGSGLNGKMGIFTFGNTGSAEGFCYEGDVVRATPFLQGALTLNHLRNQGVIWIRQTHIKPWGAAIATTSVDTGGVTPEYIEATKPEISGLVAWGVALRNLCFNFRSAAGEVQFNFEFSLESDSSGNRVGYGSMQLRSACNVIFLCRFAALEHLKFNSSGWVKVTLTNSMGSTNLTQYVKFGS